MKFGIDIDGVLGDFGHRVVEIGNTLWPGKFPPGYVPDNWDYVGYLSADEWKEIWVEIKHTPYFWLNEAALPGAAELREHLRPQDEVFFVTARAVTVGDSPLVQSSQWLQGLGLYPRNGRSVVLPVADASQKASLFQGLGIQYMLDDYAPTVQQLNELVWTSKFQMHAFCFDQPWNRYMALPRVSSVSDYLDKIRAIEQSK